MIQDDTSYLFSLQVISMGEIQAPVIALSLIANIKGTEHVAMEIIVHCCAFGVLNLAVRGKAIIGT